MLKTLAITLALTVLVGCQATTAKKIAEKVEPPKLAGQVVGITEVCKTFEHQMNIFNAFSISKTAGMQIYYNLIYSGECVVFPRPALAKKVKLEFEKQVDKDDKIEIWKVALNEDDAEVKFFWTALRISVVKPDKTKKNEIAA
jgi:hypothetical protein